MHLHFARWCSCLWASHHAERKPKLPKQELPKWEGSKPLARRQSWALSWPLEQLVRHLSEPSWKWTLQQAQCELPWLTPHGTSISHARPTLPDCSFMSTINDGHCLKPLCFGMVCYAAVSNQDICRIKLLWGFREMVHRTHHKTNASLVIALVIIVISWEDTLWKSALFRSEVTT